MNRLIIYGSHYGTAKAYAEEFAQRTGIPAVNYTAKTDLSSYDEILHFGGLYAGGVKGLKDTLAALPQSAKLLIVTVGLADVTKKENTDHIRESIRRQVPQSILARTSIFHLRGGIDYSRLTFLHKTMMSFVYKKAKNIPEEEKTAEDRDLLATYNQRVNFVDFSALDVIVDALQENL